MSATNRWWRDYADECAAWSAERHADITRRAAAARTVPDAIAIERRASQRRRMPTVFRMLGAIPWLRRFVERRSAP